MHCALLLKKQYSRVECVLSSSNLEHVVVPVPNSTGFLVATLFVIVPNLMDLVMSVILYLLKIFEMGSIFFLGMLSSAST
jgi:hypothetical protein